MKKIRSMLISVLISCILAVFAFTNPVYASLKEKSTFQVIFIDVAQGDAALISCDGHYMLIDGGNKDRSSLIYSYLKRNNVNELDYIVATHPDADHVGGLAGALNCAKAKKALCSVTEHDTEAFENFVKYLDKQGTSITVPKCGDRFNIGSARVSVIGPVKAKDDSNNSSIVLRVVYGRTSFLFTGDAEEEEETEILNNSKNLKSTVLKAGHHGSSTSTSYRFLKEVSPQYAIISVGKENSYGHPTKDTLSRLRDADVKTYRTDMQGSIICLSDGKNVSFKTQKNPDADTLADSGAGQKSDKNTSDNAAKVSSTDTQSTNAKTYILNTNTRKFHYPNCSSVKDMKEKNKQEYTGSRDDIIAMGYAPCKRCKP